MPANNPPVPGHIQTSQSSHVDRSKLRPMSMGCQSAVRLEFQSKSYRHILDGRRSDPSNAYDDAYRRHRAKRCRPFARDDHNCKIKGQLLKCTIIGGWVDRHTATYTTSCSNAGVWLRMIGTSVSTIHWLSQSHCHGLKRKSTVSISSQRPINWNGNTDTLLLWNKSCRQKSNSKRWHFNHVRHQWLFSELTTRNGGHSIRVTFSWPTCENACWSIEFKCGLLVQRSLCSAGKLPNAPWLMLCNVSIYEMLSDCSFGNDGKMLCSKRYKCEYSTPIPICMKALTCSLKNHQWYSRPCSAPTDWRHTAVLVVRLWTNYQSNWAIAVDVVRGKDARAAWSIPCSSSPRTINTKSFNHFTTATANASNEWFYYPQRWHPTNRLRWHMIQHSKRIRVQTQMLQHRKMFKQIRIKCMQSIIAQIECFQIFQRFICLCCVFALKHFGHQHLRCQSIVRQIQMLQHG